ncbi:MAG: hypothetical protein JWM27_3725 [Gemmatimonadetes bacterium]|nr:hypothetical protein [Gemmatimonadota bacterium]
MKKLALDLDALCVETFETAAPSLAARGTVRGQAYDTQSCPGVSCARTCGIPISPDFAGDRAPISYIGNCCV